MSTEIQMAPYMELLELQDDKIDLTYVFRDHSDTARYSWMMFDFMGIVRSLKYPEVSVSFWEDDENWAVLSRGSNSGYVHKSYPTVFCDSWFADLLLKKSFKFDGDYRIYVIVYKSKNSLITFNNGGIGGLLFEDLPCGVNCISIEDLWFRTNSI